MDKKKKIPFGLDKRTWHPSPLIGQIVLVTTVNADNSSNVAPKSWISMMAFDPPILALGCNFQHTTARNILRQGELVVNIPGAELAEVVWRSSELPHPRPVEAAGLTAIPALKVAPPRIEECKAHLECVHDHHVSYGEEVIILVKIVAVSIDEQALEVPDAYEYLQLFAFLEADTFGVIKRGQHIYE